jgi:cation diffusion facilitator CzcD-associated flavoprotein CzcO
VAVINNIPMRIKNSTEWKGARWLEKGSRWHVYLEDIVTGVQFIHETKVLMSAVGAYTNPHDPNIPGLESFEGQVVHTARWEKDYDLRGRNVVIFGNGCQSILVDYSTLPS